LLVGNVGTNRPIEASARIGDSDGAAKWRIFAKAFEQDGNTNWQGQEGNDDWRQARIGGRADIELTNTAALQFSAEAYQGKSGVDLWDYSQLPTLVTLPTDDEYDGAFATIEWSSTTASVGHLSVRAVIDHTNRTSVVFDERRDNYDLELQHNLPSTTHHDLMWGVGIRHTADSTHQTAIAVVPASDTLTIYNAFVQDEIGMLDDAVHVTIGGKIEQSDYIGTQFMPNLRVRYSANERTVLWAAVSRGIRSAARLERDVRVTDTIPSLPPFSAGNPTPAPVGIEIWGDPKFAPEKLTAYELGLRHRVNDALSFDLATYYNQYSDMRGVQRLPTVCAPSMTPIESDPLCAFAASKIIVPMQFSNLLSGSIHGIELTATWSPAHYWRLVGSYAYLNQDLQSNTVDFGALQLDFAAYTAGQDAKNQWSVRSSLSLGTYWDWDLFLRHVDQLPAGEVPAYTELNTRIAWRPRINFELALTGQNLLHSDHQEFRSDFLDLAPVAIRRAAYLQARWSF
jgi:iron complex outermembrane receptor protein